MVRLALQQQRMQGHAGELARLSKVVIVQGLEEQWK